jgi:hypothetical protein
MAVEYALLPQSANTIIQLPMPERRWQELNEHDRHKAVEDLL